VKLRRKRNQLIAEFVVDGDDAKLAPFTLTRERCGPVATRV